MQWGGSFPATGTPRLLPGYPRRTLGAACALVLLVSAAGCATGSRDQPGSPADAPPGVATGEPAGELVWPPPPDTPRVRYLSSLRGESDTRQTSNRSFWSRLWSFVLGKSEPRLFGKPVAVAVAPTGEILVADGALACLHVLDLARGRYRRVHEVAGGEELRNPVAVAVTPDGRMLVADAKLRLIAVYTAEGKPIAAWGKGELARPAGLALGPDGSLYVADPGEHQIVKLGPDGDVLGRHGRRGVGPGEFNFPTQVAVGPSGAIWVLDTLNFRVQELDREGKFVRKFGTVGDGSGNLALPKGIAIGPAGVIWISDAQFDVVQLFRPDGRLLLVVGGPGRKPGQFWLPSGIAFDGAARIYVADSYNGRVEVFDASGAVP